MPRANYAITYERLCGACGEMHTTHKPKAARCQPCIDAKNPVRYASCLECGTNFTAPHGQIRCEPCAGLLGLDQYQRTAKQREEDDAKQKLAHWVQRRDLLDAKLAARGKQRRRRRR